MGEWKHGNYCSTIVYWGDIRIMENESYYLRFRLYLLLLTSGNEATKVGEFCRDLYWGIRAYSMPVLTWMKASSSGITH